jgi:riboflavin kinase/FMN adenylyltransferase
MNIKDKIITISGKVIKGSQLGRTIDFPTANIDYKGSEDIKFGVYGVIIRVLNKEFRGVLNVGVRPTIDDGDNVSYEVNICKFDCDIYGEDISCDLIYFVRSEMKFNNADELKRQIQKDIFEVREKFDLTEDN